MAFKKKQIIFKLVVILLFFFPCCDITIMSSNNQIWVTEPSVPRPLLTIEGNGFAALNAETILETFEARIQSCKDSPAFHKPEYLLGSLHWKTWTWKQYWDESKSLARVLVSLNILQFEVVNIMGVNSPEWMIANMAAIIAGCIPAGIYTSNSKEICANLREKSAARIIFVDSNKNLAKFVGTENESSSPLKIVLWNEPPNDELIVSAGVEIYEWNAFLDIDLKLSDNEKKDLDKNIAMRQNDLTPGHCAIIIYTSGTTGPPKAVMLSHDNIIWTAKVFANIIEASAKDRIVSYLPLSHIAAQMFDVYGPIVAGIEVYFAGSELMNTSVNSILCDVSPTLFLGVPRIYEKMKGALEREISNLNIFEQYLISWAQNVGLRKNVVHHQSEKQKNFIYSKIKTSLGLVKARLCISSAAPLSNDILNFFAGFDIPIYAVFGQSECSGPHTTCTVGDWRPGYCGKPLPGTESKVLVGNNELCYRGRHIFLGYMHDPAETAASIDENGYIHSGDIAEISDDGNIKIIGRIKEILVTSGGENIAPNLIEDQVTKIIPEISHCLVIGDNKNYLTMLISLKSSPMVVAQRHIDAHINIEGELIDPPVCNYYCCQLSDECLKTSKILGSKSTTVEEVAHDILWFNYLDEQIKKVNLHAISNAYTIRKWRLLPTNLTIASGDLTPTLKLKRAYILNKYKPIVDAMYDEDDTVVPINK